MSRGIGAVALTVETGKAMKMGCEAVECTDKSHPRSHADNNLPPVGESTLANCRKQQPDDCRRKHRAGAETHEDVVPFVRNPLNGQTDYRADQRSGRQAGRTEEYMLPDIHDL